MAYDVLEPLGPGRATLAVAGLTALTANMSRRQGAPTAPEDWIPYHAPPLPALRERSEEEIAQAGAALQAYLKGRAEAHGD